jgi:glutathione-regulated potassium-efflux system protein KefB
MAMGAFVAGVLLSESSFRHQLEADIEPFRGLLLGLFFLTVGMSLDLGLVIQHWGSILFLLAAFIVAKAVAIYVVARLLKSKHAEAVHRALLMAQGGEFAFVLFTAAAGAGIFGAELAAQLTAVVILSMALTPLLALAADRFGKEPETQSLDGIDVAEGLTGTALIIGFGRFGQVVSQALLSRSIDVSIIDADTDMIRAAARFGFKIYYGDGTRLDVLRAAGATDAKIVAVCVDDREAADKVVAIVKAEFPLTKLLVRSFDRGHTLDLIQAGVDFEIRETFESAMKFGEAALLALGVAEDDARETLEAVRSRDAERLQLQITGGLAAGRDLLKNQPLPTPLTPPKRGARPLNEETAIVADSEENDPVPPG